MKAIPASTVHQVQQQLRWAALDHLDPAAARGLLRIKFKKSEVDRVHELSELAKQKGLSKELQSELEGYLQLGSLLTMIHSKARLALKPPSTRARRKSA